MGWGINQYQLVRIPVRKECNGYYIRWYYNGWHYWFFKPGTIIIETEGEKYRTIGTRKIRVGTGNITRGQAIGIRSIMMTREVSLLTNAGWMNIRIEPSSLLVYDNQIAGTELEFTAIIGNKEPTVTTGFSPVNLIPIISPDTTYCEVIIGTQVWMCANFNSNYPGSKVYNNDETYRSILGGLYTANMVRSAGFCPPGWHVPTLDEWTTLINYVGGLATAGGDLKEVGLTRWDAPNTGAVDTYGFTAVGSGFASIDVFTGLLTYSGIYLRSYFWTQTASYGSAVWSLLMSYDSAAIVQVDIDSMTYCPVRLIKDTPATQNWFLGSEDEVMKIKTELYDFGVGGFSIFSHWTSTEFDLNNARHILFFTGIPSQTIKSNSGPTLTFAYTRTFTTSTVYALRDAGEQGGWIFHIVNNGDGTFTYYEAKPSGLFSTSPWSNIVGLLVGTGSAIGTGKSNTLAIISQPGHTTSVAKLCNLL